MVECETNNNKWMYNGYGCYCGFGGTGEPLDGVDRWSYGGKLPRFLSQILIDRSGTNLIKIRRVHGNIVKFVSKTKSKISARFRKVLSYI